MVFFTCNACGQAVKKNQVEKHTTQCRNCQTLSCIDCNKDFHGDEYKSHTKCITEEEKYSGLGFKPKPGKGEKKQEDWLEIIRKAIENSKGDIKLLELLNTIITYDNIPRKQNKFENFLSNCGQRNGPLVARAWAAINDVAVAAASAKLNVSIKEKKEKEIDESNGQQIDGESKKVNKQTKNKKAKQVTEVDESVKLEVATDGVNGNENPEPKSNGKKSKSKKRKHEPEIDNKLEQLDDVTKKVKAAEVPELKSNEKRPKNKKRKIVADSSDKTEENSTNTDVAVEDMKNGITIVEMKEMPAKFKWRKVAQSVLMGSSDKSMSLKKLKKRVFGEYKMWCQSESCDRDEIYNKIQDKLFKQKFQLENEIVKLIL